MAHRPDPRGGPRERDRRGLDCSGVTFPPTVVICSDPELIRLTDERQQAINEARARIGERAWPVLWEDQRRWVPSYATACGVPPDRPPPDPVPASIKECFRRAGEARIAYLRSYGVAASSTSVATPAEPTASGHIGPSYDCSKATTPLTLLICVDPGLSRLDLRFGQAYWALFQQLDPSDRKKPDGRRPLIHRSSAIRLRAAKGRRVDSRGMASSRLRPRRIREEARDMDLAPHRSRARGSGSPAQ